MRRLKETFQNWVQLAKAIRAAADLPEHRERWRQGLVEGRTYGLTEHQFRVVEAVAQRLAQIESRQPDRYEQMVLELQRHVAELRASVAALREEEQQLRSDLKRKVALVRQLTNDISGIRKKLRSA